MRALMQGTHIVYGLVGALAIALTIAAITDARRRQIDNWLNAAIAAGAPLFWWASGLALWPGVALQIGLAVVTFFALAGLFALKAMGGGDAAGPFGGRRSGGGAAEAASARVGRGGGGS